MHNVACRQSLFRYRFDDMYTELIPLTQAHSIALHIFDVYDFIS